MDNLNQKKIDKITKYLYASLSKIAKKNNIEFQYESEKLGYKYTFPDADFYRPFHIASIGKMFTATIIFLLKERGLISLDDSVTKHISEGEIRGLFEFEYIDYSSLVTVGQLLNHTSGVADYFDGPVHNVTKFSELITTDSNYHWNPDLLIEYSRNYQKAVAKPGEKFNYSDTGYIILGKIIENVTSKSFHENLHEEIFNKLEMNDSYLMFYSEPKNAKKTIDKIFFNNVEISTFRSLTCDWAGGGIISTTSDLIKFMKALIKGQLIKLETLEEMSKIENMFKKGIYYGSGMMEIHFEDFSFLLKKLPKLIGHIGVLSTYLFYDPVNEAYIAMNLANDKNMVNGFKLLATLEMMLK